MNVMRATYARGADTATDEIAATFGPWGFDPADLRIPLRAWHGTADETPIEVIRYLVDRAPDATLVEYEGEAHVLDEKHHDEWLATLTAWAR